jgi:hypothetical protein
MAVGGGGGGGGGGRGGGDRCKLLVGQQRKRVSIHGRVIFLFSKPFRLSLGPTHYSEATRTIYLKDK